MTGRPVVWVESLGAWLYLMGTPIGLGLCYERTNVRTYELTNVVLTTGLNPYATQRARKELQMNPTESARIVELAASIWPVRDNDLTRDAWFLALSRTNFYDAMDAIGELAREKKTVHVSDIAKRAERIRATMVASLPPAPDAPSDLADDPRLFILWQKTARERQLNEVRMRKHSVLA